MAQWARATTPWRQGRLLTTETARRIGLAASSTAEDIATVVISHDCDIAHDAASEPHVEVIVGRFIDSPDGNFTHAKNPRCLHIKCDGDEPRWIELRATNRHHVPKLTSKSGGHALVDHTPAELQRIEGRSLKILQVWLAARYRRSAFPDEFDRRLRDVTGVGERLAKIFTDLGSETVAVFFDIDEGEEVHREGPDDPYELQITLLYDTSNDPHKAKELATKAAIAITKVFEARCFKNEDGVKKWNWVELKGVDVIADVALSYANSQLLTKWNADYISLRANPPQPVQD